MDLYFPGEPYQHQKEVVQETWDKLFWALFWEMGTGKSYALITTIVNLYLAGKVDTVLYVAKKGELANFRVYEIPKYWPEHIPLCSEIYQGYVSSKHVAAVKRMLAPFSKGLKLYSINIESLRSGKPLAIAEKYLRTSKKTLIAVDESTTLKDPKSSQTKALMHLRNYAKYARIMTGTVIPHGPVDVWSQARFLNPDAMPGYRSITAFKADFLEQEIQFAGPRRYLATLGPKNMDRLQQVIKVFASVLTKADCLDLPPKIYKDQFVKLTDEQERLYQEMVDFSIAEIGDKEYIEGVNALAVAGKLHQIVCGQVRMPDGTYRLIQNNRYSVVEELCETILESQKKVIIWSHYVAASQGLMDYLTKAGLNFVFMPGGLSIDERQRRIAEFKTNDKVDGFLANPQSSGFGSTLTEAKTAIYYSNSDNYEHRLQSEDRNHRIGQDEACLYIDCRTPGTVEDRVYSRNALKASTRLEVMGRNDFIRLISLG